MFTEFDRLAMTRALALAERGLETTHPNPRVGCVIAKGDRIIGEGFHERAGEPHAEVMALRSAKEPVAGATAYVTLEPCSHHGRTPPCANALIEARIARVVFAVQDPNPRVSGQGADALLRAGITVEAGLMQNEATELNIGFMKRMKDGLPWVRVKLAMSLDGRTALANGASQWITGEAARADVQRWRARCSAVMTGVGTVLADDPQLNVRQPTFKGRQPLRVVLDARLRSPVGAKVFAGVGGVGSPALGVAGAPGGAGSADAAAVGAAGPAGAAGGAGAVSGAVSGGVVVFTAEGGGGVSAATGAARSAPVDRSVLADDMAELVSAFETSPTSVAAREADLAGPVSVKSDARPSAPLATAGSAGKAGTAGLSSLPAAGSGAAGPSGAAAPMAPASAAAVSGSLERGAADKGSASGVVPPVLAAAGSVAGVAPTADDATWAGAALSGAVPVNREAAAPTDSTASGASASLAVAAKSAVPGAAAAVAPSPAGAVPTSASAAAPSPASTAPATAVSGAPAFAVVSSAPSGAAAAAGTSGAAASGALVAPASGPPSTATASTPPAAAPPPLPVATTTPAPAAIAPSVTGAAVPQRTATPAPAVAKSDSPATFQVRKAALSAKGVRIEEVPSDDGYLDLFVVLKKLGEMEVNEVLVEAGPTLAGQLLTTFLVDELLLYVAPKLLGPQGRPLVNLPELQSLQDAWGFSLFDAKRFGDDLRLRMRPK